MYQFVETYKHPNNKYAVMIVFQTNTDFAANIDLVRSNVKLITTIACGYKSKTISEVLNIEVPYDQRVITIGNVLSDVSRKLGESFTIEKFEFVYLD